MTADFAPLREFPKRNSFGSNDVMVIFGELFQRGYVNGIVEEAQKRGMKIIYSTVGRREKNNELRLLTQEELQQKAQPLINIPLEAGFDLDPSSEGVTPVSLLEGIKMSEWEQVKLDFSVIDQCRKTGIERFRKSVTQFMSEVEKQIPAKANVVFVHTMAGGIPRARIVMPLMNRIFKGFGERYLSSKTFWESDIGRLCDITFKEVTGDTFFHLIDLSSKLRTTIESRGGKVSYVAYGYHGNEVLIDQKYRWQSYSPYLQGWAKLQLESVAQKCWAQDVKATVFNVPEILTNSSSIFLGVELPLYPLLAALMHESSREHRLVKRLEAKARELLKDQFAFSDVLKITDQYFKSEIVARWSDFPHWPQHNGPEQMTLMRETSNQVLGMHKDTNQLLTQELSEVVFKACGSLMLDEASAPRKPVWWIGHDAVARRAVEG